MVTVLDPAGRQISSIAPSKAAGRVEARKAEWVHAEGVAENRFSGTIRMLGEARTGVREGDGVLLLAADGTALGRIGVYRGAEAIRAGRATQVGKVTSGGYPRAVLLPAMGLDQLQQVVRAYGAVAIDHVQGRSALRAWVEATVQAPATDLSDRTLDTLATQLADMLREPRGDSSEGEPSGAAADRAAAAEDARRKEIAARTEVAAILGRLAGAVDRADPDAPDMAGVRQALGVIHEAVRAVDALVGLLALRRRHGPPLSEVEQELLWALRPDARRIEALRADLRGMSEARAVAADAAGGGAAEQVGSRRGSGGSRQSAARSQGFDALQRSERR